ncbi:MAG: 4-(cytidine 5'-diphospho)-2-C-methyl-D-erythritol kinase [Acidimicrobiia bacterium]|nr:4-(cytidine 5'-diphospho)-2-C-methyl-D-erythritol kinase [Acidimicrobiia bacterium]
MTRTPDDAVTVRAPAKLTLTLRVLGTRPDGFHELDALTVMVSEPSDTLTVGRAPAGEVTLTVEGRADDVPHDETNLVVRAARAVLPADSGASIALTKTVPSGAGLGGGSADAAAVLRVLRDRHGIDDTTIMAAAETLGSDVPVCVMGRPVMMRGRGERLEPVELADVIHLVIATPGFPLSTPAVFRAWDAMGEPRSDRAVEVPWGAAHLVDALVNDLEPAAEQVAPELREFRQRIESITGMAALLAGSGSSYWLPVTDAETAAYVAARLSQELQIETVAGHVLRTPVA